MNIGIKNQQRKYKVNQKLFKDKATAILLLCGLDDVELSILIVNNQGIRVLNEKYRGIDSPTDVLAFPMEETPLSLPFNKGGTGGVLRHPRLLGDIVISTERTDAQSREQGHSFNREFLTLLTHGILHLLGYDHEKSPLEKRRMKKKESFILSKI